MKEISLRYLLDNGLLFEINRKVLHPLGLALALEWKDNIAEDDPETVILLKTDDPDGIVYEKSMFNDGNTKFENFLGREGGHKLAERLAILGFVEQAFPLTSETDSN